MKEHSRVFHRCMSHEPGTTRVAGDCRAGARSRAQGRAVHVQQGEWAPLRHHGENRLGGRLEKQRRSLGHPVQRHSKYDLAFMDHVSLVVHFCYFSFIVGLGSGCLIEGDSETLRSVPGADKVKLQFECEGPTGGEFKPLFVFRSASKEISTADRDEILNIVEQQRKSKVSASE